MGGNAFHSLPPSAFPRIPPKVYHALKVRLLPHIQTLYTYVAVPFEAPEKSDHGDLDWVVAGPKSGTNDQVNVPHAKVCTALGAKHHIPMDGNRTSNYAVPVAIGEWANLGHWKEEEEGRQGADSDGEIYYQVDVHVCADKAEWDRVVFFHAFGDLGMILGLIARNNGLALGTKGLKVIDIPNPPFDLSESFDEITAFMGLSMDRWKQGFATKQEVFEWAGSCRFFRPDRFKTQGQGIMKVKEERKMYFQFTQWAKQQGGDVCGERELSEAEKKRVIDEALDYFHKKEEFEALTRARAARLRLKMGFDGKKVNQWCDLGDYWKGVKLVMDGVRKKCGGDEGVLEIIDSEGEDGVKRIVLQVRDELGLMKKDEYEALKTAGLQLQAPG